jgi:DNA-binding GntR family transcriptional regulator
MATSGRSKKTSFHVTDLAHLPALLTETSASANQTELAYTTIRRRIIQLELAPGGMFTETRIADELGVSKTPVREALVRLHHDGLVEPVPRAGYAVSAVTLRTTRDLCQFRSIIEPAAAELAAQHSSGHPAMDRLEELAGTSLAEPYSPDREGVERYLRDHFEFQAIIANMSGNARLTGAIIGVLNDLERVLRVSLGELPWSDERAHERVAIVAAIKARDGAAAHAGMLKRTKDGQAEILQALLLSPSVDDAAISVGR